jgi:hypothetical protein
MDAVMRGLDPRIHHSSQRVFAKEMDRRVKPGDDTSW